MCGTIEQASRRWRGGGRDAKLIAARRRLAEEDDREDHERDVEAGVPVAVGVTGVTGRFLRPAGSPSVNRGSTTRPQTRKLKAQLRT